MPRTPKGESVISRIIRVVEAFEADTPALTVTEIARRTGLHVATASRMIEELVRLGWLQRGEDRKLQIGLRMWEVAARASPTLSLREAAMPVLKDLHTIVGHHVQLSVLEGEDALFVEWLTAPGSIIGPARVAGRLPLHASASGQLLLAHAPRDLQERILERPLERFTNRTLVHPAPLRAALAEVRRQGHAFLEGHIHPQVTGMAVPVHGADGGVIAALGVSVPALEATRARIPVLHTAARSIARGMSLPVPPSR